MLPFVVLIFLNKSAVSFDVASLEACKNYGLETSRIILYSNVSQCVEKSTGKTFDLRNYVKFNK